MTTDTTYNGWTNYATWGVALVLDNDEGTYTEVREQARAFVASALNHENVPDIWTAEQAARFGLMDWLKDYTEQLCGFESCDDPPREPSMMAMQVMHAGLVEVNWKEIASAVLADL